ncbi:glycosyltransferase family 4 protein [Lactobacillus sp. DCY120]|uniref:Glycosyltransferase family 4 protein n=1 Tax=Bombilactobacillus apium TaxID=2675299 RepID=A0A850QZT6_9LACO|nr:glycosyltransferase family 4 protein [Bombilactobacillus apium]NVY96203.1 glycosyltransferase family 4 protein [Bombilactobacillus apium]
MYRNMFVHTRLLAYKRLDPDISFEVFVISNHKSEYEFEGIGVLEGTADNLRARLDLGQFDKIVIHFLTYKMVQVLLEYKNIPQIVWVHGFEALSWKRRLFNARSPKFLGYIFKNSIQLHAFHHYVEENINAHFVFVSKWMKKIASDDTDSIFHYSSIIPNGIDSHIFSFQKKDEKQRYKVLLIRPFTSRKYATDIAMKAIEKFSMEKDFLKYTFTIAGEGKYLKKDTAHISKLSNVTIIPSFQSQEQIEQLHNSNGVFLCPSRQDAQGVSMCEAMMSGLIPITSRSTAIPEFVDNQKDGYLTNSVEDIVDALRDIGNSPIKFGNMSVNSHQHVLDKCEQDNVIQKELSLIVRV